jgi:hypothetical protein
VFAPPCLPLASPIHAHFQASLLASALIIMQPIRLLYRWYTPSLPPFSSFPSKPTPNLPQDTWQIKRRVLRATVLERGSAFAVCTIQWTLSGAGRIATDARRTWWNAEGATRSISRPRGSGGASASPQRRHRCTS